MTTISGIPSGIGSSLPVSAAAASSSVAKTSNMGLVQTAVTLSGESGIVASLGGASTSALTYDASGLLTSLVQAAAQKSSAAPSVGASATASAQTATATTGASATTATASSPAAGVYSSTGAVSTNTSWASILKAHPAMAATVAADSFNQGIVGTLSTLA